MGVLAKLYKLVETFIQKIDKGRVDFQITWNHVCKSLRHGRAQCAQERPSFHEAET